ncbi:large ribosomal subunit protein mL62 isoform 2-T2 [Odontesthes bonariensis]|uniref:large ribosomal subunit protein mL62 isoform X2 n=1 Tax=Odontesthes bonariensis TaxID=219752 RepID=UPI003F589E44
MRKVSRILLYASTSTAEALAAVSAGPLPDINPISSTMVEMCSFSSGSHLSVFHWTCTKLRFQQIVSTKAEVRFHLHTADWIPEDVRQKIFQKNKNRMNKAGELLVTSEMSRSQQRNLSDCIQKISAIIAEASEKPHEPTAEDVALREARLQKRDKQRLKQKKIHSTTKHSRRVDFD